jgi:hypothetical protein
MLGEAFSWRDTIKLLSDPVGTEKRALLAERWKSLPASQRFLGQGFGQKATGCSATIGIKPKCDFACTGCYLGEEANQIPSLPIESVLKQLDEMRGHLGPKGNVQITDGEVTLLPESDLLRVLNHARSLGLIPMLMTHGDGLRHKPGLLERLMVHGGLRDVSIHIDITQRGRDGYKKPRDEKELDPLRDEFTQLLSRARRDTRLPLRAATTLTITRENLGHVADVTGWMIENRDAFRMISFQPLAQVGRTQKGLEGVTSEALWSEIARATERFGLHPDDAEPIHFGHSACTRVLPVLAIVEQGRLTKLLPVIRKRSEDQKILSTYFNLGLGGITFRDDRLSERMARAFGTLFTAPDFFLGPVRGWINERIREELGRSPSRFLAQLASGALRVEALTLTSHHFMSPWELETDLGRERSAACVFRLPVHGDMVPMCQVNAGGVRERFYAELIKS